MAIEILSDLDAAHAAEMRQRMYEQLLADVGDDLDDEEEEGADFWVQNEEEYWAEEEEWYEEEEYF